MRRKRAIFGAGGLVVTMPKKTPSCKRRDAILVGIGGELGVVHHP